MHLKSLLAIASVFGGLALLAQPGGAQTCKSASASDGPAAVAQEKDIVEVAMAAGKFNTLVAAVKAAGLVDALKGAGPLTVFAPTDDAFAKLPKGAVEDLLKPENKAKLVAILTYHVAAAKLPAAEVTKRTGAMSLQGQRLTFKMTGDAVTVDGANVVTADVAAKNGVIHAIDRVIFPTEKNCVEVASAAGTFSTLIAAAKAAGLAETLSTGGPFTIFAPNDAAFAKLPKGAVEDLLKPENKEKLAGILKLHVVAGRVDSTAAASAPSTATLQGGRLDFTAKDGALFVGGAKIVATDINASNGIIHVIDQVILPK